MYSNIHIGDARCLTLSIPKLWIFLSLLPINALWAMNISHRQLQTQSSKKLLSNKTFGAKKEDNTTPYHNQPALYDDFGIDGLDAFINSLNENSDNAVRSIYPKNEDSNADGFVTFQNLNSVAAEPRNKELTISSHSYHSFRAAEVETTPTITDCLAQCHCEGTRVDCSGQDLSSVPPKFSAWTTWLDLSLNKLSSLPEMSFKDMNNLKELRCMENNLTELPSRLFRRNKFLRIINFQGNQLTSVPHRTFQNLTYLVDLFLSDNKISKVPKYSFMKLTILQNLALDDNLLEEIPVQAFKELPGLQALTIKRNKIQQIPEHAFQNNTRLIHLTLNENKIKFIDEKAFHGLTKLKHLDLEKNKITNITSAFSALASLQILNLNDNEINFIEDQAFLGLHKLKLLFLHNNKISVMPSAFSHLVSVQELHLQNNMLQEIPDKSFHRMVKLKIVYLEYNRLKYVAHGAFKHLPALQEIKLDFQQHQDIIRIPDLTGTKNLTKLHLTVTSIKTIPESLCSTLPHLNDLTLKESKIETITNMRNCIFLNILDLSLNEITSINGALFDGLTRLKDMLLNQNYISVITQNAFLGLHALEYLNLQDNRIKEIHPNAFLPLKAIKRLNLGNNRLYHLPTAGLSSLKSLLIFHNEELHEFPAKAEFPNVIEYMVPYAYQCCDLIDWSYQAPQELLEDLYSYNEHPQEIKQNDALDDLLNDFKNLTIEMDHPELWPFFSYNRSIVEKGIRKQPAVNCKPKPGPFMPCDDLFGWWSLRCGVWLVFMLAVIGNSIVFFVSVTSKSKMDVPRFLICNLAMADFFMGLYLGFLAVMDSSTLGNFKKYAIKWQRSASCQVAGTLGVLSSEASVFTLTVITLERFYAITHAMQLNKRLSLRNAGIIMFCCWVWSFSLAILPLIGISDYRKFAVCLPFEIEHPLSKSYVCFLLIFNGISFLVIMICYVLMYISIRNSHAWNTNDTRVAKRMALLVFTDFLCWAPIATLSLTAAFGKNLIHLNEAKVLTIFILPLNSCANPFLYAFFTKQFKRDCVLLCRRLEEIVLTKSFSQVPHPDAPLSWKYQWQPAVLGSLTGAECHKCHHQHSSSSNGYSPFTYNSEVTTVATKSTDKEATESDSSTYAFNDFSQAIQCTQNLRGDFKYQPSQAGQHSGSTIYQNSFSDNSDDEDFQVNRKLTF